MRLSNMEMAIYPPTASFTHLLLKLVLAAPASFFSSAAASQLNPAYFENRSFSSAGSS